MSTAPNSGEYVVVARRYRPGQFDELLGQEHVAKALRGAIESHRVGHAYLFTGARGVGKTSAARILAKALNCVDGPTAVPCTNCDSCQAIAVGEDIDVLEIDGASNRGIDEIRQLRQNVNIRPSRSRFKIYIIDEVHMLTREAFNALLKTLEEPPEHVKFIFCTTEAEKVPVTVLSRCQRFDFAGIQTPAIAERLRQIVDAEGVEADDDALRLLARRAGGSMRDSQSLLEQLLSLAESRITIECVHQLLGTASSSRLAELARHIVAQDSGQTLASLDAALAEGVDVGQLLDQLLGYFRDLMIASVGGKDDLLLHAEPAEFEWLSAASKQLGVEAILAMMQVLDQALERMRVSIHRRTLAELALVRVCSLGRLRDLSDVIEGIRSGAPPTQRGATAAPAKKNVELTPQATAPQPTAPPKTTAPKATPKKTTPKSTPTQETPRQTTTSENTAPTQASSPGPSANPAPQTESVTASSAARSATANQDQPSVESVAVAEPTPPARPAVEVWKTALSELGDLIADHAALADRIEYAGADRLVVEFPPEYSFQKSMCERPDQARKIVAAINTAAGRTLVVQFRLAKQQPASNGRGRETVRRPPRVTARDYKDNRLVKDVADLFSAHPTKVEPPPDRS